MTLLVSSCGRLMPVRGLDLRPEFLALYAIGDERAQAALAAARLFSAMWTFPSPRRSARARRIQAPPFRLLQPQLQLLELVLQKVLA